MYHDLFQICRADRKPGGKSCISARMSASSSPLWLRAPMSLARSAAPQAASGPCTDRYAPVSACFFPLTATRPDWM